MPRLLATAALLLGLLGPAWATAAPPAVSVRGPYCPPAGCAGAAGSPLGSAAGFATAAGVALLLARRRGPGSLQER
ncbi:MAG: hypothetical protein QNK04_06735 [Myxococcota bacterium]|nr:hypothetical protein [Myxococcota bacterium]